MPIQPESVEREPLTLEALDGYPLSASRFLPAGESKALVIFNSATGVLQRYYIAFAEELARWGFTVLTFDYRGIGGSRRGSLRGFDASMADWARLDFAGVLRWSTEQAEKRFVIGHSFGGQALTFTPGANALDGAVLIAVQSGYWRHWSGFEASKIFFLWHVVIPTATGLCGYLPGSLGIGEDLPREAARQWARWGRHPEYAFGLLEQAEEQAASLDMPILALSFSDDTYAPRRSVEALLAKLRRASIEHRHQRPATVDLRQIGHFGFFRQRNAVLWPEVLAWLEQQASS